MEIVAELHGLFNKKKLTARTIKMVQYGIPEAKVFCSTVACISS